MDWSPAQYLKFESERGRPIRDLLHRVAEMMPAPQRILDLGCGPGNSTLALRTRWPLAHLTGLDSSETMLASARAAHPELRFEQGDIAAWANAAPPGPRLESSCDLVFSNSALHWVQDHLDLLPSMLARVAPGGALAFQVPANDDAPVSALAAELSRQQEWRAYFPPGSLVPWSSEHLHRYYDQLAPTAAGLAVWETRYFQPMPNPEAILDWYRGSGFRVYLAALPDEPRRARFTEQYLCSLRVAYPLRASGEILFSFRRRFVVAQREPNPA